MFPRSLEGIPHMAAGSCVAVRSGWASSPHGQPLVQVEIYGVQSQPELNGKTGVYGSVWGGGVDKN